MTQTSALTKPDPSISFIPSVGTSEVKYSQLHDLILLIPQLCSLFTKH
uniref:Uncharacterized protein n=1 Tax=Arundo donax TaxID=35708 RepID=A0A0A8ZYZ4_ARUDO